MAAAFSGPDVPAPWGAGQLGTQQGDEGARGRAGVGPPHRVGQTPVTLFQRERDHAAHGAGHGLRDDAHTQVGSDQHYEVTHADLVRELVAADLGVG
ncbi:hypothetical protein BXO557_16290, partial [Xanthomonas oryzae pv. oryzae]